MKSKFSIKCYILPILPVFLTFAIGNYLTWFNDTNHPKPHITGPIFFVSLISFTTIWLVFGELRNKMVRVTIDDNSISSSKFGGLLPSKTYRFADIDGFKLSFLRSRAGGNEYLYIMQDDKKVIKISDFYHKNYSEIKEQVRLKTTDLGFENFSYIDELKEIFT